MASYNKVQLMGNVTRDLQVRRLDSGTAVCDIGLAVSETHKGRDGKPVEQTCFVDVVAWDKQAETCAAHLGKGSPVFVEGRLQCDEWTTDQGEKRRKIRVRADRVLFIGPPRRAADERAAPPSERGRRE